MKPIKGLPDDGPPCGCVVEMADSGEPVLRPCAAHARLGAQRRSARRVVYDVPVAGKFRTVPTGLPKELPSGEPELFVFPPRSQGTSGADCGCHLERADDGRLYIVCCAEHEPFIPKPGKAHEIPLLERHDASKTVDCLAELAAANQEISCACPKCKAAATPAAVAAVVPGSKPGRGGRRANQKGRPRKLHHPVSRSFTLERRLVERLEVLASLTGRPVADVCRSALELGVKNLEWGQHDKP